MTEVKETSLLLGLPIQAWVTAVGAIAATTLFVGAMKADIQLNTQRIASVEARMAISDAQDAEFQKFMREAVGDIRERMARIEANVEGVK